MCVRLRRSPRSVDNAVVTGIGWALFGVGAGTLLAIALTSDVGPQNQGVLAEYPEHYNPPPAPVPRRRSPFASNAILLARLRVADRFGGLIHEYRTIARAGQMDSARTR
jgi:hypothetical protein